MMVRVRRLGTMVATAALVALATMVPSAANAVDVAPVLPGPVVPLPSTPAQLVSVFGGQSTAAGESYLRATLMMIKAMRNAPSTAAAAKAAGTTVEVAAEAAARAAVPVPITAAAPLSVAGRAVPLVNALAIGFAIGGAGVQVYGMLTGTDPLAGTCGQAEWVQTALSIAYLGATPNCQATVAQANSDQSPVWAPISYGGQSYVVKGTILVGSQLNACLGVSSVRLTSKAYWAGLADPGTFSWPSSSSSYCGSAGFTGSGTVAAAPGATALQKVEVYNSGGVLVGTTTPTQADPTRTPSCTIQWSTGGTTSGTGVPYKESTGIGLSAQQMGCKSAWDAKPDGAIPQKISVDSNDGTTTQHVISQNVNGAAVPEVSPGTGGLVLSKVVGTTTQTCMDWKTDCSGWWAATSNGTTTGTYTCTFDGASVALAQCSPYQTTFDTQTSTPTVTDPVTGDQIDWSTSPDPGNSIDPGTDVGTGDGNCFAGMLSFNPVDWVLTPVKCALKWAFVPDPTRVQADVQQLQDSWADTMPAKIPGIVSSAIVVPNLGSGCQGPHVAFSVPWSFEGASTTWAYDGYPLSACAEPMATTATFARLIGAAILIFYTGLGVIRRVSGVVHAPGLGGGGSDR